MITREDCQTLDVRDPLAPLRDCFALDAIDAAGEIYLDGNSLGALPRATPSRLREVVEEEWGGGLIRSWNRAGWITMAQRLGDKIAPLIGAGSGEVVVADSTSINLFKALSAALALSEADSPHRRRIVTERTTFPTDLYIAGSVARARGFDLAFAASDDVARDVDERTAVLLLTHVDYRTGRLHDLLSVTRAAHDAGAMVLWDLSHSAGVVPIDLAAAGLPAEAADFAVGCGYKYLNGGPGAPAFLWVHPRHVERLDREGWRPPLPGWLGHAAPFDFAAEYEPAPGMGRFVCGTPPILSLAALECGLDVFAAAGARGGIEAIREKSRQLTTLFIDLVEARCAGHGLALVSPRDPEARGSQVSFARPTGGYAIVQALIARGVIGDFRAPDVLRFGFVPLYTRFVDVWDAVDRFAQVLASGEWREGRFSVRATVT